MNIFCTVIHVHLHLGFLPEKEVDVHNVGSGFC